MTAALLLAGVVLLTVGSIAPMSTRLTAVAQACQLAGIVVVGASGAAVFAGAPAIGGPFRDAVAPAVGVDPVTGFFLLALAVVAVPGVLFAVGSLAVDPSARALHSLTGLFVLAMVGVLLARDVTVFLACWELMTLLPATMILLTRRDRSVRRTVFVYLAMTHLGGAGVWVALLATASVHGFSDPTALAHHGVLAVTGISAAAAVGFGTKAGLMPLHSWLPRAHPVAPAHASALMSGMMIKVAVYGLVRLAMGWLGPPASWLGWALLVVGALSALGGVVYALVQHELKRLLAFHSIENVGIIALGLGAYLLLRTHGASVWASLALAAALLHTLNHATFKALLFLGAGAFGQQVGSLDLDRLGGLLRRMPWTGGSFLIGAMAIAGLPPLNGFASEWLTMQALVHTAIGTPASAALPAALAAAALAATAALAALCFVKVVGLTLLGPPRREACARASEVAPSMRTATVFLAACCVGLGLAPGLLVSRLVTLTPHPAALATAGGIAAPGTGGLPTVGLLVTLVGLAAALVWARSRRVSATAPVWICGQPADPALAWTSAAFTKPLRLVLEPVLRPERSLGFDSDRAIVRRISYASAVPHLFDTHLFEPVVRAALAGARIARRLQSGSLRGYALSLLVLVLTLLVFARLGVLS
ncbi:MAG TPA: proton-conducting transporter membrane subunit [Mycobacteriales bacterium]|nr:proton-conducting transporter membrane subunit [Gaiellales bacterium]HVB26382.1 proton-conducting transporter membrane subunit [Mycobacteriales bacterium]